MIYLSNDEIKNINQINITDFMDLSIDFDNWINKKIIFKGIESLYLNKDSNDNSYSYYVDNVKNFLVDSSHYNLIDNLFPMKYDQGYFKRNISKKLSLILIEWDITIYILYKSHTI